MHNYRETETASEAVSSSANSCAAHSSRRLLTRHLKTCSLVTSFTNSLPKVRIAISRLPKRFFVFLEKGRPRMHVKSVLAAVFI
jgi:hypothetical protein